MINQPKSVNSEAYPMINMKRPDKSFSGQIYQEERFFELLEEETAPSLLSYDIHHITSLSKTEAHRNIEASSFFPTIPENIASSNELLHPFYKEWSLCLDEEDQIISQLNSDQEIINSKYEFNESTDYPQKRLKSVDSKIKDWSKEMTTLQKLKENKPVPYEYICTQMSPLEEEFTDNHFLSLRNESMIGATSSISSLNNIGELLLEDDWYGTKNDPQPILFDPNTSFLANQDIAKCTDVCYLNDFSQSKDVPSFSEMESNALLEFDLACSDENYIDSQNTISELPGHSNSLFNRDEDFNINQSTIGTGETESTTFGHRITFPEVLFSAGNNYSLTKKTMVSLNEKYPKSYMFKFFFIEVINLYGNKTIFLEGMKYSECYQQENESLESGGNELFLFGLYEGSPIAKGNRGRIAIIMPMEYQGISQHNRYYQPKSNLIVKYEGYYVLDFELIFTKTSIESFDKKQGFQGELVLPFKKIYIVFLKENFTIMHAGQKLMVSLCNIKNGRLLFSIFKAQNDTKMYLCLQNSGFILNSLKMKKNQSNTINDAKLNIETRSEPSYPGNVEVIGGNQEDFHSEFQKIWSSPVLKSKIFSLFELNGQFDIDVVSECHTHSNGPKGLSNGAKTPERILSDQENFLLTVETMKLLYKTHPHMVLTKMNFIIMPKEHPNKTSIIDNLEILETFDQSFPSKTHEDTSFLFILYSGNPRCEDNLGISVSIMPMIHRGVYQYSKPSELESEIIIKCDGCFIILFEIILFSLNHQTYNGIEYKIGFGLPWTSEFTLFFRENFVVLHAGQKFLVSFYDLRKKELRFSIQRAKENDEMDMCLQNSVLISESKRMIEHDFPVRQKNASKKRNIFEPKNVNNITRIDSYLSNHLSALADECLLKIYNSEIRKLIELETQIYTESVPLKHDCSGHTTILIDEMNLSSQENLSLTIKLMYLLQNKFSHMKLIKITCIEISKKVVIKTNILEKSEILSQKQGNLSLTVDNDKFFMMSLYCGSPKTKNNLGKLVLIMPMTHRGIYQYNKFNVPESQLIIKLKECFVLHFNIIFIPVIEKSLVCKNQYRGDLVLPGENKYVIFLKRYFVVLHAGQKYMLSFRSIANEKLRFSVYKAPEDFLLDVYLEKSNFVASSEK